MFVDKFNAPGWQNIFHDTRHSRSTAERNNKQSDYNKYIKIKLIDVLHDKAINKSCSYHPILILYDGNDVKNLEKSYYLAIRLGCVLHDSEACRVMEGKVFPSLDVSSELGNIVRPLNAVNLSSPFERREKVKHERNFSLVLHQNIYQQLQVNFHQPSKREMNFSIHPEKRAMSFVVYLIKVKKLLSHFQLEEQ